MEWHGIWVLNLEPINVNTADMPVQSLSKKIKFLFISFGLLLFILTFSLTLIAYNGYFYRAEFEKLQIYEVYDDADLRLDNLLSYLRYQEDLSPEYYSRRDIRHMEDVRNLLSLNVAIMLLSFFLIIKHARLLKKSFLPLGIVAGVFLLLSLAALSGFSELFLLFHKLAFTNDFWLLNPLQDTLINLFPEQFFLDALRSAMWICFGLLSIYALFLSYIRFINRNRKR